MVNPVDLIDLLYDAAGNGLFTSVREYTVENGVLNGEIGQIGDIKLIKSALVPEGVGLLVDVERVGYQIVSRNFEGTREDFPEFDQIRYHLYSERDFGVSNSLAIGVLVNAKSGRYGAVS